MGVKIIIADDHPIMASALAQQLEGTPEYEVIQLAHSFDELMVSLKENPDILILDINLNGINAIERMSQIKAFQPGLKVLIFSSYNTPSLVKKAINQGVDGYILKDTDGIGLFEALKTVVRGELFIGKGVAMEKNKFNSAGLLEDSFIKKAQLSQRELEVMSLIIKGKDSKSIAEALFISKHTVQSHRKNLFKKLGVHSAKELIKLIHDI